MLERQPHARPFHLHRCFIGGCCRCLFVLFFLLTVFACGQTSLAHSLTTAPPYRIEQVGAIDASEFPRVTIRFQILDQNGQPARQLPNDDIVIFEDHKEVHRLKPMRLRNQASSVMLAIDTSGSMEQLDKLNQAKRAANNFLKRIDPKTPCGLVLFHHHPYLTSVPTLSRVTLSADIASATARGGTAYFDAIDAALEQLPPVDPDQKQAIVIMTDGRDVNSSKTLTEIINKARSRKVQVYTLGLGKPGDDSLVRTVLVLDRSGSMRDDGKFKNLLKAARRYIELMPSEAADTTIIVFNDRIEFALNPPSFTSDKSKLIDAIERFRAEGETRLYDSIIEALNVLDASQGHTERRMRMSVIALTDGMDNRSIRRRFDESLIPLARKLHIPVYMLGLGNANDINEWDMKKIAAETGGQYYHIANANQLTDLFEQLSVNLHDQGIDEVSLRQLAHETGGEYFHATEADKLEVLFEQVATSLENTYAVSFRSLRDRPDGTGRSVQIRFLETSFSSGYKTHGMITPLSDPGLYFGLLFVMLLLLWLPSLFRRIPHRT